MNTSVAYTPEAWSSIVGPVLFLSASFPESRDLRDTQLSAENRQFVASARPERITEAIHWVAKAALQRGMAVVFGGHPTISPLILTIAQSTPAPPGVEPGRVAVMTFQSRFFEAELTEAALDLGSWDRGRMYLTAAGRDLASSLERMRRAMLAEGQAAVRMGGAVFIGGMHGLYDEARLFASLHPDRPMFALAATGGASSELARHGVPADRPRRGDPVLTAARFSCDGSPEWRTLLGGAGFATIADRIVEKAVS